MPGNFIDVISIPVTDQQQAKTFYLEHCGFDLQVEAMRNAMLAKGTDVQPIDNTP